MCSAHLHSLPINPFDVCNRLGIPIVSYSEACDYGFHAIIQKISCVDVDGFCCKGNGDNYIILYDNARTPKERINFTIAHELGHIVLGHLKNVTMRPRYMTNRRNDPLEKEADAFAGELIRPPIPFVLIGWNLPDNIRAICNITYEAATVCSKLVRTLQKKRNHPRYFKEFHFYHTQFFDFLYAKYCGRCRCVFVDASARFCPICANKFLHWYNERLPLIAQIAAEIEGDLIVKYKEYAVSDKNQVIRCIRCDNEELRPDDWYCKICGAPVYNYCTGQYSDTIHDEYVPPHNPKCESVLPSNARFCTSCGAISSFYYVGLLPDWQEEMQSQPDTKVVQALQTNSYSRIPDDDIPF